MNDQDLATKFVQLRPPRSKTAVEVVEEVDHFNEVQPEELLGTGEMYPGEAVVESPNEVP